MTKSALQIARAAYQPKVPAALKGAVKAVDGEYTESVADQEDIKKLFPNTYGMPIVTFEKSNESKGRAITGLSMGGHGGLWTAIRHKDTFGACGSTSGGVDIRPFPKNWDMAKRLGDYESNKEIWDTHTVINQIDKIQNGDLAIIFDCGEADFFIQVNKDLHNRLLEKKIDHDFITRPGGHTGEYWNNAIDYQILFFDKFFKK